MGCPTQLCACLTGKAFAQYNADQVQLMIGKQCCVIAFSHPFIAQPTRCTMKIVEWIERKRKNYLSRNVKQKV